MTIEPVKNYKTPAYPTIERYVYNPQEFLRHAPHSWLGNAAVWTALVTFSLNNSCCAQNQKPAVTQTDKKTNKNVKIQQEKQQQTSRVAPIFVHGEGTGAFGCIVTAPPVLLSEEDALQIIKNEFAKHNIVVDSTKQSVEISVNQIENVNKTSKIIKTKKMEFDGEIKNINFLVEYVSSDDYDNFKDDYFQIDENGEILQFRSSVSGIDTKKMADSIRKSILKENKHNAVVFYDPLIKNDKAFEFNILDEMGIDGDKYDNMTEEERETFYENLIKILDEKTKPIKMEAQNLLIQQVTDFIEWLKKEKLLTE